MSKELKKLVDQDVIEPVESSEWISPIVVTTRKDRPEPRLCVDLREPNKSVVVDGFPLPHMEEMFAELRGASLFSTLDLQSAYHQMPLRLRRLVPLQDGAIRTGICAQLFSADYINHPQRFAGGPVLPR